MTQLFSGWRKVPRPFLCLVDTPEPGAKVKGMSWQEYPSVVKNPEIMSGEYVFRGTRVPVRALFENLRDGATIQNFVEWFPGVSLESTRQALRLIELSLQKSRTHRPT